MNQEILLKGHDQGYETHIIGRIEKVTFASNETGFVVLRVRPSRGGPSFVAVGSIYEIINDAELNGLEIELCGHWEISKFGRQFVFKKYRFISGEIFFFLTKVVKGIGKDTATLILSTFTESEIIDILDNNPNKLLEIKGIKHKRLEVIINSWNKHKSLRHLASILKLNSGLVTPNLLIKIYNYFGNESVEIIKENPYRLCEIRGIGFKTADKIALSSGISPTSEKRIMAAVNHILLEEAENNGHSFINKDELIKKLKEILEFNNTLPNHDDILNAINHMIQEEKLIQYNKFIGLSGYYFMEIFLLNYFQKKSKLKRDKIIDSDKTEAFIKEYEDKNKLELSEEQKLIIKKVAEEPYLIYCLAGYAGTGKTTTCRAILEILNRYLYKKDEIVCCAFTGMASSRIRKATGYDAFTIHSLLKYQGENNFEHNENNPLPYKVIVLDESSMVNLQIFYRLIKALKDDTILIMVGDPAQLPPIGAGNVFSDILEKNIIPTVKLTKIYRQSENSVLTLFANKIREGKIPEGIQNTGYLDFKYEKIEPNKIIIYKKKNYSEKELKILREENNKAILNRIKEIASYYSQKLEHPVWDFQVLSPMRIGLLGTENLNITLQNILNTKMGESVQKKGYLLKEGDKVVHLQNKDMLCMDWDEFIKNKKNFLPKFSRRIFNGSVGLITKLDIEAELFYVVYPERIVVAYPFDYLGDIIEHAYCLTVHKAQGSQFKIVVIPLTESHYIMLNNKWFYTAITRAEEKCYIIGQEYALKRACTNVESVERNTWLKLLS